jgi:hypothetical protein
MPRLFARRRDLLWRGRGVLSRREPGGGMAVALACGGAGYHTTARPSMASVVGAPWSSQGLHPGCVSTAVCLAAARGGADDLRRSGSGGVSALVSRGLLGAGGPGCHRSSRAWRSGGGRLIGGIVARLIPDQARRRPQSPVPSVRRRYGLIEGLVGPQSVSRYTAQFVIGPFSRHRLRHLLLAPVRIRA